MDTKTSILVSSTGFWQLPQIETISNEFRDTVSRLIADNFDPDLIVSELYKASAYNTLLYSRDPLAQLQSAWQMIRAEILTYEPDTIH